MRTIKFRGKRADNGEWVYGWYTKKEIGNLIVPVIERYREWDTGDYVESIKIIPETVSQYTGLKDKNDVDIYEGDLRKNKNGIIFRIYHTRGGFAIKDYYWKAYCKNVTLPNELVFVPLANPEIAFWLKEETKHVGNIHANPDILWQ